MKAMLVTVTWILSILGIAVTYLFLLGAAMSTVPQKLNLPNALVLVILPVIVLAIAGLVFQKGGDSIGRFTLLYAIPCLLSITTLIMIATSVKLPQIGGPFTDYYGKNTDQPRYSLEIRAASQDPKEGWYEMKADHDGSDSWYVSNETLFTHADLHHTTTYRETRKGPTTISLTFHGGAQPRVQELSSEMLGGYWAVLLNGQLWMTFHLEEPLQRTLTLAKPFEARKAAKWAQRIMQE